MFVLYFLLYNLLSSGCPAIYLTCESEGGEQINTKKIPLSCDQVCTNSEFVDGLIKLISFQFIIPLLVIYVLESMILYLFSRKR
ncbi:MAG: hypothetical protein NUV46_02465 [Nanoarchaeota archaeon]|nr:hypothetical protein [Nanoarchaeota archaeon]